MYFVTINPLASESVRLTLLPPVTLQTERAEWLQFQRDLQVAVSVADRLRAEAEQALGALREHHGAAEARLAQALRRQQEQDRELRDLEALLAQRRRRERTPLDVRIVARGPAKDGGELEVNVVGNPSEEEEEEEQQGNDGKEEGGRENCAVGTEDSEEKPIAGAHTEVEARDMGGHCEAHPNGADDGGTRGCAGSLGAGGDPESGKTQLAGKGVAEAYLLSLAAIKKKKKEAEAGNGTLEHRRVVMLSERSW